MTRAPISRIAAAAGIVVLAGACTLSDQDPPPLTGPSEFAQSIVIAVSPDVLPQDGASQSFITVTARDANAQPIRNLTMRTETQVNGTPVDFGTLSARNVVTGSDGRATFVYTAPPSPAVSPDDFLLVDIVVTPFGSDFNNSSQRTASIRLVPQGRVIPPGDLVPAFTITPTDAGRRSDRAVRRVDQQGEHLGVPMGLRRWRPVVGSHSVARLSACRAPMSVPADSLRLLRPNRSRRRSRSPWRPARQPTAAFVFSPTNPRVGQSVNFNASASRGTGRRARSPATGGTLAMARRG